MNMILHGHTAAEIERGNTLAAPRFTNRRGIHACDGAATPWWGCTAQPQATRTLSDGPDQHPLGFRDAVGRSLT